MQRWRGGDTGVGVLILPEALMKLLPLLLALLPVLLLFGLGLESLRRMMDAVLFVRAGEEEGSSRSSTTLELELECILSPSSWRVPTRTARF